MTSISADAEAFAWQMAVITQYLELPDTPLSVSLSDQRQARRWFEAGISLSLVEAALLLGSLRRLMRPPDAPPLPPIRSLAYFRPVVEELLEVAPSDSYRQYLRGKMQQWLRAQPGVPSSTG